MSGSRPKSRLPYKAAYSQEDVVKAMQAVSSKQLSINKAADLYKIPRTTLKDKLSGRTPVNSSQGPNPALTKEEESEIATWAINMCKIGYGRTKEQILDVVQQLLEKHPRPNLFLNNKPGREWWEAFLKKNPSLALRVPENLSKARALSCTKEAIFKWFRDLETYLSTEENCPELLEDPCRIYNADEAGFPLNPKSEGKVLAEVGSKDVYAITSSDRTQITILACGNAAGIVIPPMAIFPGERFKYNPLHGCVPNTYLGRSKNGWMDSEVFYMWIANHFVNSIPPVRPVLLFVDGHATHIDKQTTQFCKENGIILYCLPAHASHIVQPLDVAFFRPLKLNWGKAVKKYKDNNPGQVVTKMVFSQVFKEAWDASNKPESLINGYRDSGLYPWNPAAINEGKFAPSAVFTKPPVENSNDSNGKEAVDEHVDHQQVASGDAPIACASPAVDNKSDSVTLPVTAATPHSSGDNLTTSASSVSFNHKISPIFDGIISYPKVVSSKPKRRSEIPKALTSKQMEMYLQAKSNEKQEKELNKQKRKEERQVKRQLKLENESKKKIHKKKGSLKKTQCGVCKQIYTEQSCAEWVGCDGVCDRWFHIKCTDIDVDFENLSPVEIQEEVAEIEWFCKKCLKS